MPACENVLRPCLWSGQTATQALCDRRSAAKNPAELQDWILAYLPLQNLLFFSVL